MKIRRLNNLPKKEHLNDLDKANPMSGQLANNAEVKFNKKLSSRESRSILKKTASRLSVNPRISICRYLLLLAYYSWLLYIFFLISTNPSIGEMIGYLHTQYFGW